MKKICFLINWMREFNMFEPVYSKMDKKNITFIINDLNTGKRDNKQDLKKISKYIEQKNFDNILLSKVLDKRKFEILLSTGDLPISIFTIKNLIKFLYARSIGYFLQLTNISYLLKFFFGTDFTAKGKSADFYDSIFIENRLSDKCIKFPNGLDRNIKHYPDHRWKKVFNIFFTSSLMEEKLINKKFSEKKTYYVGYPRFDESRLTNSTQNILKEFNFDNAKKNIICLPNERIMIEQNKKNMSYYIKFLNELSGEYNLLLRPHPKLEYYSKDHLDLLESENLKIDKNHSRKIIDLFEFADLAICDYGSSVVESIYLKKKLLIYEWGNEQKFKLVFDKKNCLDNLIREEFSKININSLTDHKKIRLAITELIESEEYQLKINSKQSELFGNLEKTQSPITVLKNMI